VTVAYVDTSALVELYVDERGAEALRRQTGAARALATAPVAHAECRAALARRRREGTITARELPAYVAALDADWDTWLVCELTPAATRLAGELAERHALRGFDAVHLACAVDLAQALGTATLFLCYDQRLAAAAAAEGLRVTG
jgi:predicted nucleic acid-binding protein